MTGLSLRIAPKNWSDWLLETLVRLSASGCSRTGLYEVLTTVIEDVSRADLVGSRRYAHHPALTCSLSDVISLTYLSGSNMSRSSPMLHLKYRRQSGNPLQPHPKLTRSTAPCVVCKVGSQRETLMQSKYRTPSAGDSATHVLPCIASYRPSTL